MPSFLYFIFFIISATRVVSCPTEGERICYFPIGENFNNVSIPPELVNLEQKTAFCCGVCNDSCTAVTLTATDEFCHLFKHTGWVFFVNCSHFSWEIAPAISPTTELITEDTTTSGDFISSTTIEPTTDFSTTIEATTELPTTIVTTIATTTTQTTTNLPINDPCRYEEDFDFIGFPGDCQKYYLCYQFTSYEMRCSDSLIFDCVTRTCWFPQLSICCDDFNGKTTLRNVI